MRRFYDFEIEAPRRGQSLVEILVGIAVGTILILGAITIIAPALRTNTQTTRAQVGIASGRALVSLVKSWVWQDWHKVGVLSRGSANHYHLTTSTSPFAALPGDEALTIQSSTYRRYFFVEDVYRDAAGNIAAAGSIDPSTLKVTVAYDWPDAGFHYFSTFVSRAGNNFTIQSDWSAGPGQNGPVIFPGEKFSAATSVDYSRSGIISIQGI